MVCDARKDFTDSQDAPCGSVHLGESRLHPEQSAALPTPMPKACVFSGIGLMSHYKPCWTVQGTKGTECGCQPQTGPWPTRGCKAVRGLDGLF